MAMVGLELGSLEFLVCPLSTCRLSFSKVTSMMLLMRSSSHLLCGSNILISRGLNVPSAFPLKHAVVSHSKPNPILFMGSVETSFANTFSPSGTNSCDGFSPCSLSSGVFQSRPFLTPGQDACCTFHQRRQNWRVLPEWILCACFQCDI